LSLIDTKPYNGLKTADKGIRGGIGHLGFRALGEPKVNIKFRISNIKLIIKKSVGNITK
jgi:hypothetical protein